MKIDPSEITFKFRFREDENFPATMVLNIGEIEIRGFSVRKSQFKENSCPFVIFPPASKAGKGWLKIFYTANKSLWSEIQNAALAQFDKEHSTHLFKEISDKFGADKVVL